MIFTEDGPPLAELAGGSNGATRRDPQRGHLSLLGFWRFQRFIVVIHNSI